MIIKEAVGWGPIGNALYCFIVALWLNLKVYVRYSVKFVSFKQDFKRLSEGCSPVYVMLKLLSGSPKSKQMSGFFEFLSSAKQQNCCAVQNMLLVDFLKTKKNYHSSSHFLSAFLVQHERSAAYQNSRI